MAAYLILFFLSFLSATIVPLGIEPIFIYHVLENQQIFWPVIMASLGNIAGSITLLWMGILGNRWLVQTIKKEKNLKMVEKATTLIKKFGTPVLLISWLPFIGDIMVMLVGLTKPKILPCIIYLALGKTARFIILGWGIMHLIG